MGIFAKIFGSRGTSMPSAATPPSPASPPSSSATSDQDLSLRVLKILRVDDMRSRERQLDEIGNEIRKTGGNAQLQRIYERVYQMGGNVLPMENQWHSYLSRLVGG